MSSSIIIILILNFIISFIGTLAYAVRLVGIRTGKIAISFALFNVLILVSRVAVTFQVPILTKHVEAYPTSGSLLKIFYMIILLSGLATIVAAVLIPTFQRIMSKAVKSFSMERSISKLILHSFSKSGVNYIRDCIVVPVKENLKGFTIKRLPKKIIILNLITVGFITVGALSPIYAGSIEPSLRATCITLSSIINGVATIIMSLFIDPQLSVMTDDVVEGKCSEEEFRMCVVGMVGSKTLGTFFAVFLLVPAAYFIVYVARLI